MNKQTHRFSHKTFNHIQLPMQYAAPQRHLVANSNPSPTSDWIYACACNNLILHAHARVNLREELIDEGLNFYLEGSRQVCTVPNSSIPASGKRADFRTISSPRTSRRCARRPGSAIIKSTILIASSTKAAAG